MCFYIFLPWQAAVWSSQSRLNKDGSISLFSLVKWSSPQTSCCLFVELHDFISACPELRSSELNAASRYGPTSGLSREGDCFPFCSSSAPVSAAQGALGLCCHQETLLAHMLLDPLSVHQVLNTSGSHSVSTSSSARVFSFPAGGLAICSHWILWSFCQPFSPDCWALCKWQSYSQLC